MLPEKRREDPRRGSSLFCAVLQRKIHLLLRWMGQEGIALSADGVKGLRAP